jgi:hypothetical protein
MERRFLQRKTPSQLRRVEIVFGSFDLVVFRWIVVKSHYSQLIEYRRSFVSMWMDPVTKILAPS